MFRGQCKTELIRLRNTFFFLTIHTDPSGLNKKQGVRDTKTAVVPS